MKKLPRQNVRFLIGIITCVIFVFVIGVNDAYALAIFLRPDGLGSGNNWPSGTYDDINESDRDDADFITSGAVNQNRQDSVVFSFSGGVDPFVDIDHVIRYTIKDDGKSAQNNPSLVVTLQQGNTALITWTERGPLPTTFTLITHEIPPEVVAQIGDYNDLRIKFTVNCERNVTCVLNEIPETISISWVEFQYETYTTLRSHPPPEILGLGIYKIDLMQKNSTLTNNFIKTSNYSKQSDITDLQNYGKYSKSGKFYNIREVGSTFEGKIGEPIQTQVKIHGVFASTRIEHLSLISTNTKSNFKLENFEISADKGKIPSVVDPNKILKNVKSTYSLEDGILWVNFDMVFLKPLDKSNIILQTWDEQRRPVYAEIADAWKIIDSSKIITPTVQTFDRVKVAILQKISQYECEASKSCYDPAEITIRKGGSVVWKNEDSIIHTIVSGTPKDGPDGKFNFAIIPRQSYERFFPFVGTYAYYCSLHPWYTGIVNVSENVAIEIPNHQYVNFQLATSTGIIITNGQIATLDHSTDLLLSGHIPNVKKRIQVDISIKRPDTSVFDYTITTTKDGHYSLLFKTTKWQNGKFEITGKQGDTKIGQINFIIADKTKKK